jgi:hypothetical protein
MAINKINASFDNQYRIVAFPDTPSGTQRSNDAAL